MKDEFEQVELLGFRNGKVDTVKEMVTEVFQDPTPLSDIKKGKFISNPIPEAVKKGRSHLIDGMIAAKNGESGEMTLEKAEISDITRSPVTTRVSLSFDREEDSVVICSRALTNFDREVIDAVSSLAPTTQIMTASTIYRIITGKDEKSPVNQGQKKRVEDSMKRCARCQVTIDITSEFKANAVISGKNGEEVRYMGNAISYEAIEHQVGRGTTTYYKINSMPPFYRFAEKLGKISIIPFKLLDSPVSKTDNIISVQSYLLREIDNMKRNDEKEPIIKWEVIYQMAYQEGKNDSRQENKRTRDTILKILDFWVEKGFILEYQSCLTKNNIKFSF